VITEDVVDSRRHCLKIARDFLWDGHHVTSPTHRKKWSVTTTDRH
jgi:hypothetical protein